MRYQVIVGNVGQVEHTNAWMVALGTFKSYVTQSLTGTGRPAGEDVTIINGDNIMPEYDFVYERPCYNCGTVDGVCYPQACDYS